MEPHFDCLFQKIQYFIGFLHLVSEDKIRLTDYHIDLKVLIPPREIGEIP